MKTVNDNGLAQIRAALDAHHKTPAIARAVGYARDVEQSILDGQGAEFELRAHETWKGRAVICRITDEGLDG